MKNVIEEIADTLIFVALSFLWLLIGTVPTFISLWLFFQTDEPLWLLILLSHFITIPINYVIIGKSLKYLIGVEN